MNLNIPMEPLAFPVSWIVDEHVLAGPKSDLLLYFPALSEGFQKGPYMAITFRINEANEAAAALAVGPDEVCEGRLPTILVNLPWDQAVGCWEQQGQALGSIPQHDTRLRSSGFITDRNKFHECPLTAPVWAVLAVLRIGFGVLFGMDIFSTTVCYNGFGNVETN